MNYPYYNNNPYMNELQAMRDRIDKQMSQFNAQQQMQQPTNLTQNFQLAPQGNASELDGKYANTIEEVKSILAIKPTIFINKDNTLLWFKNVDGNVKSYTMQEIVEKDEKDIVIDNLRSEIAELKEMIQNAKSINANVNEPIEKSKSSKISNDK